jgi:hypothetical protein
MGSLAVVQSAPVQAPAPLGAPQALAELLVNRAGSFATIWRRHYCGDRTDPLAALGLLDDVVESLVLQLGAALGEPDALPAAAWGRTCGVLRLSITRGVDGLVQEFGLLRNLLEDAAERVGAPRAERRRLRILLDAAQAQALLLQHHRANPGTPLPAVAFGGVVVEVS